MRKNQNQSVDNALVAMFLDMTPEELLKENARAGNVIAELRDAYQRN